MFCKIGSKGLFNSKQMIKQNRCTARVIIRWFDSMCTDEENEILLKKDPSIRLQQHDIGLRLTKLIRVFLRQTFESHGMTVPKTLMVKTKGKGKHSLLKPSAIVNRLRDISRDEKPPPVVTNESFMVWRRDYEKKQNKNT